LIFIVDEFVHVDEIGSLLSKEFTNHDIIKTEIEIALVIHANNIRSHTIPIHSHVLDDLVKIEDLSLSVRSLIRMVAIWEERGAERINISKYDIGHSKVVEA
jgi:hypothetical protein